MSILPTIKHWESCKNNCKAWAAATYTACFWQVTSVSKQICLLQNGIQQKKEKKKSITHSTSYIYIYRLMFHAVNWYSAKYTASARLLAIEQSLICAGVCVLVSEGGLKLRVNNLRACLTRDATAILDLQLHAPDCSHCHTHTHTHYELWINGGAVFSGVSCVISETSISLRVAAKCQSNRYYAW